MPPTLSEWIENHYSDYVSALTRVEKTRTLLVSGTPKQAGEILKKAYVFAVLSIRTGLERHERAFTQWASGDHIAKAAKETVYGNQKGRWITETFNDTDWTMLGRAIQNHLRQNRYEKMLESITDLKGVSYRKGGFTLAMAGARELICIDSNVAEFAGLEESEGNSLEFYSAGTYLDQCEKVVEEVPNPLRLPAFLLQWSIYDWMRGEHARHMSYYREVLPETLTTIKN